MKTYLVSAALICGLITLSSCDGLFGDEELVISTLMGTGESTIEIPSTGNVGEDIPFRLHTVGKGECSSRRGPTRIEIEGLHAEVTPYDYIFSYVGDCQASQPIFHHTGVLRFDQQGVATVVVSGRLEPGGEIVTVERLIAIQ